MIQHDVLDAVKCPSNRLRSVRRPCAEKPPIVNTTLRAMTPRGCAGTQASLQMKFAVTSALGTVWGMVPLRGYCALPAAAFNLYDNASVQTVQAWEFVNVSAKAIRQC